MNRIRRLIHLALVFILTGAVLITLLVKPAFAAPYAQVFGFKSSGSYFGAYAQISTPDPYVLPFQWTTALTAVTTWTGPSYMEAGAVKDSTGAKHPYAAWIKETGEYGETILTDKNLLGGGYYSYKVYYINSDVWEAYFISGSGTYLISSIRLGRTTGFPYVSFGGESPDSAVNIGPSTGRYNQWFNGGTWSSYCYNWTYVNVGSISPCNSTDHSWTVRNP